MPTSSTRRHAKEPDKQRLSAFRHLKSAVRTEMSALGRLGGRALGLGAGAASSAVANPSSVQARATVAAPAPAPSAAVKGCSDDEWLLTDPSPNGDVILFRPFRTEEIDNALGELRGLLGCDGRSDAAAFRIEEEAEDGGSNSSDGGNSHADAVIAGASLLPPEAGTAAGARSAAGGVDVQCLLDLTNRMLRRPGMQSELVKALMEDTEIQGILLREAGDLDTYLLAAGVAPVSLLPPAARAAAGAGEASDGGGGDLVAHVVGAVAHALEHAGAAMGRVANWLRNCLWALPGAGGAPAAGSGRAKHDDSSHAGRILRGVLTIGVAVVMLMVLRRPGLSFMRRPPL
uniref:Uncharacterized protein n=1 Tax=Chlamydomonas euryale TaxID=1486919 RepID=A0A7R9VLC2_9CHLO|mmetsp:Transcript_38213/g.113241  ORF Transcript_38213/g.113241 Transcript_38213/m.113241 type:complete len:345 (+) Transcript_38213:19-1053(+)